MSLLLAVAPEHRSWAEGWSGAGEWELRESGDSLDDLAQGRARGAVVPWNLRRETRGRVVAIPPRPEPRDLLVPASGAFVLGTLAAGSRVALAGPRRRALLAAHRPDLEAVDCRELGQDASSDPDAASLLAAGAVDAVVLSAGEARATGLAARASQILEPKAWTPGPGQGAGVLVVASDDAQAAGILARLDDPPSRAALEAEEILARRLGFGPRGALGSLALPYGRWLRLWGLLASGGTVRSGEDPVERPIRVVRADASGSDQDPAELADRVARLLRQRGADLLPEPATPREAS